MRDRLREKKMPWFGNHEQLYKAPFKPMNGAVEVKICAMGFHGDIYGGYSEPCFGSRYEVLARRAPAWQAEVLAWAARDNRPLPARCIGSAGKYSFWLIAAASPEEARAKSAELAAQIAAKADEKLRAVLLEHYALGAGERVVTARGEVLQAVAARLPRSPMGCGERAVLLADGTIVRDVDNLAIHNADGHEVAPFVGAPATWLPNEVGSTTDHAPAWWWEEVLAAREAEEAARLQEAIERAREEKRARKAAKAAALAESAPADGGAIAHKLLAAMGAAR